MDRITRSDLDELLSDTCAAYQWERAQDALTGPGLAIEIYAGRADGRRFRLLYVTSKGTEVGTPLSDVCMTAREMYKYLRGMLDAHRACVDLALLAGEGK